MVQIDPTSIQLVDSESNRVIAAVARAAPGLTSLVANPVEIPKDLLPFSVGLGVVLDCATDDEIQKIGEMLERVPNGNSYSDPKRLYESEMKVEVFPDGAVHTSWVRLPRERWRYYVLRTDDNGRTNIDVGFITMISNLHLDVGSLAFGTIVMASWNPYTLFHRFQQDEVEDVAVGSAYDLQEIAELYKLKLEVIGATGTCGAFPELQRGMEMLNSLRILPARSSFHVLGLFAIIEMLITHNPKLEDRGDSITHQMKSKVPLLARRFERPLPYDSYFGTAGTDKIWGALYAYRSAVAHGGELDFKKGVLQLLKSSGHADAFLLLVVKAMLRHSLREPHLYRDIRDC